ncbi:MAG: hypothetical protein HY807_03100 [Nitrospirae bacterium]|nr:hypothetical protein [Nitrospirota bacterium]
MKAVVVDTNVIVVANQRSDHSDDACIVACIDALQKAREKQKVVIDSGGLFFDEYFRYANRSGQSLSGDVFVKWLWDNQANSKRCESVEITPCDTDTYDFKEFPNDPALTGFDPSDKKFVAVAFASKYKPKILNATDSGWWHFQSHLSQHGILVKFLCSHLMRLRKG